MLKALNRLQSSDDVWNTEYKCELQTVFMVLNFIPIFERIESLQADRASVNKKIHKECTEKLVDEFNKLFPNLKELLRCGRHDVTNGCYKINSTHKERRQINNKSLSDEWMSNAIHKINIDYESIQFIAYCY